MAGLNILWCRRVRDLIDVKSLTFIPYCDQNLVRFKTAADINVLSRVLMVAVNDSIFQGFAQGDLNISLVSRDTTALRDQEHELIYKVRDRGDLAWQSVVKLDGWGAGI